VTAKRRPAKRPAPRTVPVKLNGGGDFDGWEAVMRADFPARIAEDLDAKDAKRFIAAMDTLVISHNFPDEHDEIAEHMADVDPYAGLVAIAEAWSEALSTLPPR
jgi:hypothetical protein